MADYVLGALQAFNPHNYISNERAVVENNPSTSEAWAMHCAGLYSATDDCTIYEVKSSERASSFLVHLLHIVTGALAFVWHLLGMITQFALFPLSATVLFAWQIISHKCSCDCGGIAGLLKYLYMSYPLALMKSIGKAVVGVTASVVANTLAILCAKDCCPRSRPDRIGDGDSKANGVEV